jgi:hypothetical protein
VVILAIYGLWQVFRWGGHQHQALIGDLAFFLPNAAGGYCAWRVSRRTDLGRSTIRVWRLLSVAIWLYLLGDAIQLINEVILHQRPDPSWADAAYLAFYPVACAGFFAFPSRRRTRPERLRSLLDTGTVFVGGATVLWYVALGPAVASRPGFDLPDLVIFAYPIGDLLLLFGVLSLLWRGVPRASVLPLRIIATGMLMFIVADVTYVVGLHRVDFDSLGGVLLHPGDPGDQQPAGDPDRGPADRAARPHLRRGRPAGRVHRQRGHRRDRDLPGCRPCSRTPMRRCTRPNGPAAAAGGATRTPSRPRPCHSEHGPSDHGRGEAADQATAGRRLRSRRP